MRKALSLRLLISLFALLVVTPHFATTAQARACDPDFERCYGVGEAVVYSPDRNSRRQRAYCSCAVTVLGPAPRNCGCSTVESTGASSGSLISGGRRMGGYPQGSGYGMEGKSLISAPRYAEPEPLDPYVLINVPRQGDIRRTPEQGSGWVAYGATDGDRVQKSSVECNPGDFSCGNTDFERSGSDSSGGPGGDPGGDPGGGGGDTGGGGNGSAGNGPAW